MSHTPGPWVASNYEGHKHDNAWPGAIANENGEIVYAGPFSFWALQGKGAEQAEANARLIVAAPELLGACKAMLEAFEYSGSRLVGAEFHAKERMKEVVAKATRG